MKLDPRNIEAMDDTMAEVYRHKSVPERLRIADGMFAFARKMILGQVKAAHPDWTDTQVVRETAKRLSNGTV